MKIRFCGAAGTVTGSCHLLEAAGRKILVDCGLFQGDPSIAARNRAAFPFDVRALDAVVLTHAHNDHIGRLPRLVAGGFRGPIVTTRATAELTTVSLLDSASVQQDQGTPLFGAEDIQATWERIEHKLRPGDPLDLFPGVRVTLHPASHLFGATSPLFEVEEGGRRRRVLFSGDVGRRGTPIVRDPAPPPEADVLVVESTYGNRDHKTIEDTGEEIFGVLERAAEDGGNVLIPAFALGRAQDVLYHLNDFAEAGLLEKFTVWFDSPLAARILEVFRQNKEIYDEDATMLVQGGDDPFAFPRLRITSAGRDSREIDDVRDGAIIIASGGMCEGGRIRRHLARLAPRPETDLVFLGYQADGTLGRRLVDRTGEVEIDGRRVPVNCHVHTLGGFSGHAGRTELLDWARVACRPGTRVFCVHGEPHAARSLADLLAKELRVTAHVPAHLETVDLG